MGKRDRLARASRKRQKASVQALGRDVGGVDEAAKGHKRQQEERAYRISNRNLLPDGVCVLVCRSCLWHASVYVCL